MRQRLIAHLDAARDAGLALVVAPAGFGKTTLLAQYARDQVGPVAWHSVDVADAATGQTIPRLAAAVRTALGEGRPTTADSNEPPDAGTPAPDPHPAEAAGAAVDPHPADATGPAEIMGETESLAAAGAVLRDAPPNLLLIIDNADNLVGTRDEASVEHVLWHRPRGVHVVLAGRRMPGLNLLRHELSGVPGVIGPDQLKFRTWEVERLLAAVYCAPLPPDDVALLTRRTGGWAAGLAMFHLSTRGRPLAVRQRAVAALSGRWAMARGYLARTLLAGLDPEVRDFLVRTSVFEVLTGARCDRLLSTTGSDRMLDNLAYRYGLPVTVDGGHSYQCHQVLGDHLATALVDELGEAQAARWHARAAQILAEEGAYVEAMRGYARAGDWAAVRRLLARVGDVVADHPDQALDDLLPAWLLAEDPWLVLAEARGRLGHGQIKGAIERFRHAETLFGDEDGKRRCRQERRIAAIWLADEQPSRPHWSAWLRSAVRRHPSVVAGEAMALPSTSGELVRLAAELLAGDTRNGLIHAFEADLGVPVESSVAALALRLLRAALRLAIDTNTTTMIELDQIADEAESDGVPWLSRMARAARALGNDPDAATEAYLVAAECERRGDPWGCLLATALAGLHDWRFGRADLGRLARLVADCRALGAGVIQAWAQALLALASAADGLPDADLEARAAANLAASAGVPGAHVLALVALAQTDPARQASLLNEARLQAATIGLPEGALRFWLGPAGSLVDGAVAESAPPVSIRCFGGFRMEIAGRPVEIATVRARARSALRLLAMQAGQVVHREVLIETLWPDLPPAAATRNLQVTISALRGLLEPDSLRGKARLLVRQGNAYGIALPPGGFCDVVAFTDAVNRWKQTRPSGDRLAEITALRAALSAYAGELLPEEGPADWAVDARERLCRQAVQVARALAEAELEQGDIAEAVAAADYCLTLDPHDDEAWQVLIKAYTRSGSPAKAVEVRRRYAEMLASLGLPDTPPRSVAASGRPPPGHVRDAGFVASRAAASARDAGDPRRPTSGRDGERGAGGISAASAGPTAPGSLSMAQGSVHSGPRPPLQRRPPHVPASHRTNL